ncbi:hypothetical protein EW145_g842 [Phellinidium pouzarii]|uniref:Major facilitator superfamily (MFS) profile domain-containing protein n=1 Tax=Phellinidium pouzarii TaxID=167371 RepID=A0A4S4LGS7_9AGAM|nr:hypothetical protein EW145_g842 [Phellinidium pouzarii]
MVNDDRTVFLSSEDHQRLGADSRPVHDTDEEQILLTKPKPFPWRPVLVIQILGSVHPLAFEIIFPFVNQMIVENGIVTDPEQVGFYSGFIESLFSFMSFLAVMPCTYMSDHFGRKPVILFGMAGISISIGLFGMAKSYWFMIVTRCIGGTLGGGSVAMKVMLAETVDKAHQGIAFSGLVAAYRIGQIVGQPIGGLVIIYAYFIVEESLPAIREKKARSSYGATSTLVRTDDVAAVAPKRSRTPLRLVLTPTVISALICYVLLSITSEAIFALYPLFAFTPVSSGGLGLSEGNIGLQLSFRSLINILFLFFYAPFERRLGLVRMYRFTMAFWPLSIVFLPFLNLLTRRGLEGTWMFNTIVGLFFSVWSIAGLSWTGAGIIINDAAPSAEALSIVNGVGQMAITLTMALAPAFVTSLFAFSIKNKGILHGNLIWVVLLAFSAAGGIHSLTLKEATHNWREDTENVEQHEPFYLPILTPLSKAEKVLPLGRSSTVLDKFIRSQLYDKVLFIMQGFVYAIGGSLLYAPCMSYMSEWFVRRRGLANGIMFAGTAVGRLILPVILPRLVNSFGPSKTLRILSLVVLSLVAPILPFLRPHLPENRVHGPNSRPEVGRSSCLVWTKNPTFMIYVLANTLQGFAYFLPILWLPTFASELHLSDTDASLALSLLNGSSFLSRIAMGGLADRFSPGILALVTTLCTSIATFVLWGVFSRGLIGVLAFGISYGTLAGGWSSLFTGFVRPVAKDSPTLSTTLFGVLMLKRGIGNILSTPISTALSKGGSTSSGNATLSSDYSSHPSLGFDVADGVIALLGIGFDTHGVRALRRQERR